ncbi:MAG: hypothetical protein V4736_11515, partial [Bdellovibrionota bacterium]
MKKVLILVTLLGFVGCTKEVPYKYEFKDQVLSKDSVDTRDESGYIYSASVLQMSRQTVNGRPFSFGDNKRVVLKWSEGGLQVIEKEGDLRYTKSVNDKMIVEFPVDHVDFECIK